MLLSSYSWRYVVVAAAACLDEINQRKRHNGALMSPTGVPRSAAIISNCNGLNVCAAFNFRLKLKNPAVTKL